VSATPPGSRAGRERAIVRGGIAVAVLVVASEIALAALVPGAGTVVVEKVTLGYETPPTAFCPFVVTTGGPSGPFSLTPGSEARLRWGITCSGFGKGPANATEYRITSVRTTSFGFSVLSSDVPVAFNYTTWAYLNVSLRAPLWPDVTVVTLTLGGGPANET
jgi:hypothetical protein